MCKPISLSITQWEKLRARIGIDYGRSVSLISWKLRDTLGFTAREHRDITEKNWRLYESIKLDFYDEHSKTLFLLKYSDFISNTSTEIYR